MFRLLYYYKMHWTCSFSLHIIYFQGHMFSYTAVQHKSACMRVDYIIWYINVAKLLIQYIFKLNSQYLSNLLSSRLMRIMYCRMYLCTQINFLVQESCSKYILDDYIIQYKNIIATAKNNDYKQNDIKFQPLVKQTNL